MMSIPKTKRKPSFYLLAMCSVFTLLLVSCVQKERSRQTDTGKEKEPSMAPESTTHSMGSMEGTVAGARVVIPQEQIQRAGVLTEEIQRRTLCKRIRTVGRVAYDPELVVAQEEFLSSLEAIAAIEKQTSPEIMHRAEELAASSRKKLQLLGLSEAQIAEIEKTHEVQKGLILPEKTMWVYGEIYEFELSWVQPGAGVEVKSETFPGTRFSGAIAAIDPVIDPQTRSVKFRAQVENPNLQLKPNMYVEVTIEGICSFVKGEQQVIALPKDAVLDTGLRKVVWVDVGGGVFESREVVIGQEATASVAGVEKKFYPVIEGVNEGERVVTKGNFLIDSQSQISGSAATSYGGALAPEGATHAH